jgi:hypothetical protein
MRTLFSSRKRRVWAGVAQVAMIGGVLGATQLPALAHSWADGDIFAAISDGQYQQYSSTGTPTDLLSPGAQGRTDGGFTTACALNPTLGVPGASNLYTTLWSEKKVVVVADGSPHSSLATIDTTAVTSGHPADVIFNSVGDFYVSFVDQAAGQPNLVKYQRLNGLNQTSVLATWTLPFGSDRGVNAFDLASDQTTVYYTAEGSTVYRYDLNSSTPLSNFATGLQYAFGIRVLQGTNPFGGAVMVADTNTIKVFDAAGTVAKTYDDATHNDWFAISVVAGGAKFVATDFRTGDVVKFNSDGTVASTFNAKPQPFRVNGVCVKGEVTSGVVPFPSIGFFVVGDIPAGYPGFAGVPPSGNTVTFFGNNWKAANPMTLGNSSGNAMKGFVEATNPVTPTCGSTFSSGGGASTNPPASLPPRVAVIVTTQSTSTGSTKAQGTIKAIVLVDVSAPGAYSQGSGGSGNVVGIVCSIP